MLLLQPKKHKQISYTPSAVKESKQTEQATSEYSSESFEMVRLA